jgi:hypothetical protein
MGWRATIIMCILAVLAAASLWLLRGESTTAARAMTSTPLMDRTMVPRDEVTGLRVVDADGDATSYAREQDGWWMTSPYRHRIRTAAIHDLLDATLLTVVVDSIDGNDDTQLDRYALQPPRASLSWTTSTDSQPRRIDLGRTGIGGRGYARVGDDDRILVVTGPLHERIFGQDQVQWRDRALFPGMDIEVDRITRVIDGSSIVFERDGRVWTMTEPITTRVDAEVMGEHVMKLAGVDWSDVFVEQPDELSSFGLEPPEASIHVDRGDQRRTVHIGTRMGGDTQDRFAQVDGVPVVLRISGETVGSVLSDASSFIDHTGCGVLPSDVKRLVIELPEETIVLERSLDVWRAPEHGDREVSTTTVEQLLEALTTLRATEVELKETYPSELERARVTLHGFDGRPMDTVRLLRETGDSGRWGMENGDRVIRIHPDFLVLPLSAIDYGLSDTPSNP